MFRRIFNILITIPIAIILLLFMVANRQWVRVSLDPTSAETPAFAFQVPMFLVVFAALILGIILGGCLVWWRQGRYRKLARVEHKQVEQLAKVAAQEKERADQMDPNVITADVSPALAKLNQF